MGERTFSLHVWWSLADRVERRLWFPLALECRPILPLGIPSAKRWYYSTGGLSEGQAYFSLSRSSPVLLRPPNSSKLVFLPSEECQQYQRGEKGSVMWMIVFDSDNIARSCGGLLPFVVISVAKKYEREKSSLYLLLCITTCTPPRSMFWQENWEISGSRGLLRDHDLSQNLGKKESYTLSLFSPLLSSSFFFFAASWLIYLSRVYSRDPDAEDWGWRGRLSGSCCLRKQFSAASYIHWLWSHRCPTSSIVFAPGGKKRRSAFVSGHVLDV